MIMNLREQLELDLSNMWDRCSGDTDREYFRRVLDSNVDVAREVGLDERALWVFVAKQSLPEMERYFARQGVSAAADEYDDIMAGLEIVEKL